MIDFLTTGHDLVMQYGHIPIFAALVWIGAALHRHGVKMTFDLRIWKNGKHKTDE